MRTISKLKMPIKVKTNSKTMESQNEVSLKNEDDLKYEEHIARHKGNETNTKY